MSSSSEFSRQKPAKLPEKPSFSLTCSLLSQYLKERGSFGDLSLGMKCGTDAIGSTEATCQTATTRDLFPTKENAVTTQDSLSNSSVPKDSKSPQLTIFYAGQVIVFDDFPAEKAKEIMSFASKGNSQSQNPSVYTFAQNAPSFPADLMKASADPTASITPRPQPPSRPVTCADLPIMRNASLHRFLEKRKDRIAAKSPYQASKTTVGPSKPVESMPWLGIAAKSPQN